MFLRSEMLRKQLINVLFVYICVTISVVNTKDSSLLVNAPDKSSVYNMPRENRKIDKSEKQYMLSYSDMGPSFENQRSDYDELPTNPDTYYKNNKIKSRKRFSDRKFNDDPELDSYYPIEETSIPKPILMNDRFHLSYPFPYFYNPNAPQSENGEPQLPYFGYPLPFYEPPGNDLGFGDQFPTVNDTAMEIFNTSFSSQTTEDDQTDENSTEDLTTEVPTTEAESTTTLAPFTLADVKVPIPFLRIEYMISFTFFGIMYGLGFFVLFQSLCVPAAKIAVTLVYLALVKLKSIDPITLEQALEQLPPN